VDLKGRKVLVVGLGASGAAAARLCLMRGALVIATDAAPAPAGAAGLAELGASLSLGGHRAADFAAAEIIVLSPGVDHR
jgi:UDP-N-acetylmuramoylalanine--D-glutamate ligase